MTVHRKARLVSSHLCNLVKLAEELVQHVHELPRGAVGGQLGETHDVSIQNAAQNEKKQHVARFTSHGLITRPSNTTVDFITSFSLVISNEHIKPISTSNILFPTFK